VPDLDPQVRVRLAGVDVDYLEVEVQGGAGLVFGDVAADELAADVYILKLVVWSY
jgi:hypothetical protein